MGAISIRQPWAELILLGQKTIEALSRRTNIRERVHIYAERNRIEADEEARIAEEFGIEIDGLPRGVLVGTVEIVGCRDLIKSDGPSACFTIGPADEGWLRLVAGAAGTGCESSETEEAPPTCLL
jgi:hypothetical protein